MNADINPRPRTVTMAVALLAIVLVLGTVNAIFQLTHNPVRTSMHGQVPHMPDIQSGAAMVTLVVELFFIYKIFMGRNWARIVSMMIYIFGVLISIPVLLGLVPTPSSVKAFTGLSLLIQLVAYLLLFTGQGNQWFKQRKAAASK